jgi:hypothetical protein
MSIQIIRDMGRDVPKEAQDPESRNYDDWQAGVMREQEAAERNRTPYTPTQEVIAGRPLRRQFRLPK